MYPSYPRSLPARDGGPGQHSMNNRAWDPRGYQEMSVTMQLVMIRAHYIEHPDQE